MTITVERTEAKQAPRPQWVEGLIVIRREHDLVLAATRRDVFDLQLEEARREALSGRDLPLVGLEDAAWKAGITQCSMCLGAVEDPTMRPGCAEFVCDACEHDHALLCEDYAAYLMED